MTKDEKFQESLKEKRKEVNEERNAALEDAHGLLEDQHATKAQLVRAMARLRKTRGGHIWSGEISRIYYGLADRFNAITRQETDE